MSLGAFEGRDLIGCSLVDERRIRLLLLSNFWDIDDKNLFKSDSEDERLWMNLKQGSIMDDLDDDALADDDEMNIDEISSAYNL